MTSDERSLAQMRSVWLEVTHLWAIELRRLGCGVAADRVLALELKQDFSEQLGNERALRETYWALPREHRDRLREVDSRFGYLSNNLILPWSQFNRHRTLDWYADEAGRCLEAWRAELERARTAT